MLIVIKVSVDVTGTISALLVKSWTAEAKMVCYSFMSRISLKWNLMQHLIQDVPPLIHNVCIVDLLFKAHAKSNVIDMIVAN